MLSKITTIISVITASAFLLLSNSGGAGREQGEDRTGSPLSENGNTFCSFCHSAGAFVPSINLQVLDNGNPITEYAPGKTYQLRVQVNHNGNGRRFGFQAVALSTGNANAGTYGTPPVGVQVTDLRGRKYPEHSFKSLNNSFQINWTAPAAGTGNVTVYAAGVAADNSGDNFGDGAARTTLQLQEQLPSNVDNLRTNSFSAILIGNPVRNEIRLFLETDKSLIINAMVVDFNGNQIASQAIQTRPGENIVPISTEQFIPGVYMLHLSDGNQSSSLKLVKI